LVSILVCTYNRADILSNTIAYLLNQQFDWGEYEIIVIDNASTDNTKEVVNQFSAREKKIKYTFEPRLGVAIARNTGARDSKSPYIAYFDDDLIAEPDCLNQLITPFMNITPAPKAIMGKVNLLWEGPRPNWFPERYETLLSRFDRGENARFMNSEEYLVTMNVAFERETFLLMGGIREDLSRKGRMFICGGDNDIFNRYMMSNHKIFYQPQALIWHLVPKSRQKRSWLLKRIFGEGTSEVIADYSHASKNELFRRMLYEIKITLKMCLGILIRFIFRENGNNSDDLLSITRQLGRLSSEIQLFLGKKNVVTLSE
jgi:glucosyl-dolichyl phosphate glucuronosyltransferase